MMNSTEYIILWEEGFHPVVALGVRFKPWDSGFIADGIVTECVEAGWSKNENWSLTGRCSQLR